MTNPHHPIGATTHGYPRIGRDRELKRALEAFWAGRSGGDELDEVAAHVRRSALEAMSALDTVPVNTFSFYDQVLDTCVLVGAVPDRFRHIGSDHELFGFDAARYFAMARGADGVAPMEMTKWFDTNYHHLVPEIGPTTRFALDATKPLAELAEAVAFGAAGRVVVVGPITFLALAKVTDDASEGFDPMTRLDDLLEVYAGLLVALRRAGARWVQFDEPALVRELDEPEVERVHRVYARLAGLRERPRLLVATYFSTPVEALPALVSSGVDGLALDLVTGVEPDQLRGIPGVEDLTLVLGLVDGHNIWRTDLDAALGTAGAWDGVGATRSVATSCSLLHVPHDVEREIALEPRLRRQLAFADQKLAEVAALQRALGGVEGEEFAASRAAVAERAAVPGRNDAGVAARLAAVTDADRTRVPQAERDAAQRARFDLPPLPTTTIGSFPQTAEIRRARALHRAGKLSDADYTRAMREEVRSVVELQEELGLDVLVHGEPERNDMVQYFAEQLDGYAATVHGWVQSYGSRCVRPPVLFGDVRRTGPMTLEWSRFAQGLTQRPVKGMLTGPVTMLAWSFVRDDQPLATTADQVALALRDEVADLEAAGIGMIQMDEPALRETLPLRVAEQPGYLEWAVGAFRLATSGVRPDTQVHTHLCYSEFGEIIDAIDRLDADVTSIEAARSRLELLSDVARAGFGGALGPGVYDIHSPRVPGVEEMLDLLRAALESLPPEALWVNPDCGLKTRDLHEVRPALTNLVAGAHQLRQEVAVGTPLA